MRSRTAGVMTTLMRNGRDRRSGKPVKCHAILERVRLFGTRSADYIRASSHNGCIQRPNTWLHPNASLICQIFPLHRGRRPYMALSGHSRHRNNLSAFGDKSGHWAGISNINDPQQHARKRCANACRVVSRLRILTLSGQRAFYLVPYSVPALCRIMVGP